jgi:DNA-binding HxlR family transcriptional regulator
MQQVCASHNCDADECVELTSREFSVCDVICSSSQPVSFTQLKASTRLHQEIVSRIVRRLVIHGLVSKAGGKYTGNCSK